MKDSVFHFKRFDIRNERSGLKVGTDGVLLGACASIPCQNRKTSILDIGTGTGLIALMLAQRCTEQSRCEESHMRRNTIGNADAENSEGISITGIDIDGPAAEEAAENFSASPWSGSLNALHLSLQDFESMEAQPGDSKQEAQPGDSKPNNQPGASDGWDLIVSNPPFFENSLKAPDSQRSNARHTDTLSYRNIVAYASRHLHPEGLLAMILPSSEEMAVTRYSASFGLYPSRILSIRTTAAKAPKRMIIELSANRRAPRREELIMMDGGSYTAEFKALTAEFYL